MKKKRVFIVDEHQSSKQNGIGTYMQCLLDCMKGLDVELNFLSFNAEEREFKFYEQDNCTYYCFPVCNGGRMLESGKLCLPILKLYVADNEDNVFFINHSPCVELLKVLRKLYMKSRIIFTIHNQGWTASLLGKSQYLQEIINKRYAHKKGYETELHCKKYFKQEQKMYQIADDVVCLSESTQKLLKDIYKVPEEKIHLIPNGYPKVYGQCPASLRTQLRKELGIWPNEYVLLYAGRTEKSKGIDDLLIAFENLWKSERQMRLVIAGEVYRFNDFAKLTPYSASHISYLGQISKEQLQKWYQVADIGVLPSYSEQCSYTGLEMMSNGLLIVTTNGNGLRDMFQPNYNALVASIEPKLSENLKYVISSALNLDRNVKTSICHNAEKILENRYSLSMMKDRYSKLLNK